MHDKTSENNNSILEDFLIEDEQTAYLKAVRSSIQQHGQNFSEDILVLIDVLSQVLCDKYAEHRILAMDLLCELIPCYQADDLDSNIGMLFPQLLQNLLHHQLTVKKSVLQVLHVYYRHTKNIAQGLRNLIEHGINTDVTAVRNEVLVSIPAWISTSFTVKHLEKLVLSVLNCLNTMAIGESILPVTLCLEHLKNIMSENEFDLIISSLDLNHTNLYNKAVRNPSVEYSSTHESPSNNIQLTDFVPTAILENLASEKSWQTRSDAVNELLNFIRITMDSNSLKYYCRKILDYIAVLIEDSNFNVALTAMTILHQIVMKVGNQTKIHLDLVIKILMKKLSDSKLVMRKLNLRIALSLMHALSPMVFLRSIIPLLKHKSSRVREEIINMMIAALLSFPSSEFELVTLPEVIGFTLLDARKRVRHASLECFAILAQQLGPGNLSPLVSAVDILERKNKSADGLLLAVQSRLGRKMLPKINDNELVQYAVKLPTSKSSEGQLKPDIAWIVSGLSVSGYETSRSEMSDYNDNNEKRILSAGRNKLPWQDNVTNANKLSRKNAGSAPVRTGMHHQRSPEPAAVICDSWVNDASTPEIKGNLGPGCSMPVSYFQNYKNKMKKIKEAGLRADVQTVNLESENYMIKRDDLTLSFDEDSLSDHEPKTSPVPLKPTLARSASKKRSQQLSERKAHNDILSPTDLNDANLAHTLPKMKGGLMHLISNNNNTNNPKNTTSPFPSRPTIHRTPSGNARSSPRMSELSNLARMKHMSHSSPEVNERHHRGDTGSGSGYGESHNRYNEEPITYNRNAFRFDNNIQRQQQQADNRERYSGDTQQQQQPGTPKLAKSAQEKLRKLKEEQQRTSAGKQRESALREGDETIPYNNNKHHFQFEDSDNNKSPVHRKQPQKSPRLNRKHSHSNSLRHSNSFTSGMRNNRSDEDQNTDRVDFASPVLPTSSPTRPIDPDDRPIKPAKQQLWPDQNSNYEIDRNSSDYINEDVLRIEGHNKRKVQKIQPKIGASPKLKRKTSRKYNKSPPSPRGGGIIEGKENLPDDRPSPQEKATNGHHNKLGDFDSMRPGEAVSMALDLLNSNAEDWETKCEGVALLRRILSDQREMTHDFHSVVGAILTEVKNLRSQVTRNALNCIGDVFTYAPKSCEPELEAILKTVLPKAGDTNQFIKSDTEQAIEALVQNVNPIKTLPALITCGVSHRNGNIRKVSAKAVADLSEKIGYAKFCQQKMNVAVAAKLATDSQPDTRYHGRRILFLLLDHPDLTEMLRRQLNTANYKAVNDIVETLKKKGLEPSSGSATLRRSMRGSAPFNSPSSNRRTRKR